MKVNVYFNRLKRKIKRRDDVVMESFDLHYHRGPFKFIRIASKNIKPDDRIIFIRAAIHGEEISGPLALLSYFNDIVNYIHENGLKFIMWPIANPSGFQYGIRENIDYDNGEGWNDDFVRYKLLSGKYTYDVRKQVKYSDWFWSSDKRFKAVMPKETVLMHKLLRKEPYDQVVACLDIHQDYLESNAPPAAYHYSFGKVKLKKYSKIINNIKSLIPIYKNDYINSGYGMVYSKGGKLFAKVSADAMKTNKDGFIIRYDGSWPDLMNHLGVRYCIVTETFGTTPLHLAKQVNLIWIYGLVDIVKKR